jgi:hypothetical protein
MKQNIKQLINLMMQHVVFVGKDFMKLIGNEGELADFLESIEEKKLRQKLHWFIGHDFDHITVKFNMSYMMDIWFIGVCKCGIINYKPVRKLSEKIMDMLK